MVAVGCWSCKLNTGSSRAKILFTAYYKYKLIQPFVHSFIHTFIHPVIHQSVILISSTHYLHLSITTSNPVIFHVSPFLSFFLVLFLFVLLLPFHRPFPGDSFFNIFSILFTDLYNIIQEPLHRLLPFNLLAHIPTTMQIPASVSLTI